MIGDEVTRCRELADQLVTLTSDGAPALQAFTPGLGRLLGADATAAFGLAVTSDRAALTFACAPPALLAAGRPLLENVLRTHPLDFGAFDPRCPEPSQRNTPLLRRDLTELCDVDRLPIVRDVLVPCGLAGLDILRILVCDEGELLAWVGAFRRAPFTAEEQRLVAGFLPTLRHRLSVERQLVGGTVTTAALVSALEAMGSPAARKPRRGGSGEANGSGRWIPDGAERRLEEETPNTIEDVRGGLARFAVMRLEGAGPGGHLLVVERDRPASLSARAVTAAARWSLTPRQRQVLAQVAAGASNKSVAASLGCAERTIELHVTALLGKSGCDNRSELIAKFWREI